MNKKIIGLIIGLIVIITFPVLYVAYSKNSTTIQDTEQSARRSESTPPSTAQSEPTEQNGTAAAPGIYTDYTPSVVASTQGTKLLFFHAPWCPQCRAIETSIKQGGVPSGVAVIKVDYDSHQDLRQKYDVTLQTTFVKIDDAGNKIKSYTAYEEPTFDSVKRELLP